MMKNSQYSEFSGWGAALNLIAVSGFVAYLFLI
jgi:hypothetical protein